MWRFGTPAPIYLRKCLQATRVRPQNDSSTSPACVGQTRTSCDGVSPQFRADAPGQDVNPSPSSPSLPLQEGSPSWPVGHLLGGGGRTEPGPGLQWFPGSVPQISVCSLCCRGTRMPARWRLCTEGVAQGSRCAENGQPGLFPGSPASPYSLGCLITSLGLSFPNCKWE